MLDEELWHRSGHWDNYRENMYFVEPSQRERSAPLRAQAHELSEACLVFGSRAPLLPRPPLRLAEFGKVFRYEREGVLHGLLRVRAFTQDDAHVYCTLEQVPAEVDSICSAIDELYARFGFDEVQVSSRPGRRSRSAPTSSGSAPNRACARRSSARARLRGEPGGGDLLRPEDRLPRHRRAPALVAARHLPARLPDARALLLAYQGEDNAEHRPVMIHRALLGSMERFAGILIEHHGGRFPAWLAPTQAAILPVSTRTSATRAPSRRGSTRRACATGSTSAPSRSGARSAMPSSRRSR